MASQSQVSPQTERSEPVPTSSELDQSEASPLLPTSQEFAAPPAGNKGRTLIQRARTDPHLLSAREILSLQRTIGNQAVGRLLQRQIAPARANGVIQRAPELAVINNPDGAGVHKSNMKKIESGEEEDLEVRSGGVFGTGVKFNLADKTQVTVDFDRVSEDGKYVWVEYRNDKGETKHGYIKQEYVTRLPTERGMEEEVEIIPPPEVEEDQATIDMRVAGELLDGYLKTHVIGQHLNEQVTNRDTLNEQGMKKATNAESYALGELGVATSKGKASSEEIQEKETLRKQRQAELRKWSKEEIVNKLIELKPDEEAFREGYMDDETSKFDLMNQLLNLIEREAESSKKTDLHEQVWSQPEFWLYKGKDLLDTPMGEIAGEESPDEGKIPIWCDQSTSIIIATLQAEPRFKSSLEVIKQGDPKQHGHWYVLANRSPEASAPAYGKELEGNEFIIDIWGTLRLNEPNYDQKKKKWVTPPQYTTVVHQNSAPNLLNAAVDQDKEAEQNTLTVMARIPEKT